MTLLSITVCVEVKHCNQWTAFWSCSQHTPPPSLQVAEREARGLPVISVQLLFHSREKSKECGQGNVNIFRRGNELALDTEIKHRV